MTNSKFINQITGIQAGLIGIFKMSLNIDDKNISIKMSHINKDNIQEFNVSVPINADSIVFKNTWNRFLRYAMYEETDLLTNI